MSDTDVELNNDTVKIAAMGANVRLFGAESSVAARPSSYGRDAIYATVQAALAADPATARATLDLEVGTNVQAYDADLTTLGAGGSGARNFLGLGSSDLFYSVKQSPFGAVADGVTIDSTAINAALTAGAGAVVVLPGGRYKCSSAINIPSNTTVIGYGAVLDFSGVSPASRVRAHGTIGAEVLLSANATAGAKSISVASATGIAAGDLLMVHSDAFAPAGAVSTDDDEIGEFVEVERVSGTTIYLVAPLYDTYNTVDNAVFQKITPNADSHILGLTIQGDGNEGDGVSTLEIGISAQYASNLTIRDVKLRDCDYQSISVSQSYRTTIETSVITHTYRGSDAYDPIQYGIALKDCASRNIIRGNQITGGKHGVVWTESTNPGIGRDDLVENNIIVGTWAAGIATHTGNTKCVIRGNVISGCARGVDVRIWDALIESNTITDIWAGAGTGDGIYITGAPSDIVVRGNKIRNVLYGVRMYDGGLYETWTPSGITIENNDITTVSQKGIFLQQAQNAGPHNGIAVKNNTIKDSSGDFIHLDGPFFAPLIQGNTCRLVDGTTVGYGIKIAGTDRAFVNVNNIVGMTPVRLENDTQSSPVAPSYALITQNTWDHSSGFISQAAGTNIITRENLQSGETSIVIASGVIDIPDGAKYIIVDTESLAATDDLHTINSGNAGEIVSFTTSSSSRDVTFKDNTGNLLLAGDFLCDNVGDVLTLLRTGSNWREIARSNNA